MTRSEFIESLRQSKQRQDRLGFGLCGLMALAFLAAIPLADKLDLNRPMPALLIFGAFGIVLVIGGWILVRLNVKASVRCPHCNKQIAGFSGQVVIASGRCGQCGEIILSD
jgi:hypothetical protein